MLGSWHYPDGRDKRPLGYKIKAELESTLRLLFKNVPQYDVPVALDGRMTVYLTDLDCETVNVSLDSPEVAVSFDPIAALKSEQKVLSKDLLPQRAVLSDACPCDFEPALCHEPVLDEVMPEWQLVTFENVVLTQAKGFPVEGMETRSMSQGVTAFAKPGTKAIEPEVLKTRTQGLQDALSPSGTRNDPRFYALPIKKPPIQPNRFPTKIKAIFRKVLADKTNTHPNNIQLRVVFERMDMTLFANIQQDEHGNLLCTPRNELIGRNQDKKQRKDPRSSNLYLVYGFRLDNKEDIRALVPISSQAFSEEPTTHSKPENSKL